MKNLLYIMILWGIFSQTKPACPDPVFAAYPLFCAADNTFFMQQFRSGRTQVGIFDKNSGWYEPVTPLMYSPTNVMLIPDGSGISFIDNGIIKIKLFSHRSAQRIEPTLPIFSPSFVQWYSTDFLCCSAQYANQRGIFFINKAGGVVPVLYDHDAYYGHPQIIDGSLFCIRKHVQTGCNTIVWVPNNVLKSYIDEHGEKYAENMSNFTAIQTIECLSFGTTPVAFLSMSSATSGYIIGYRQNETNKGTLICFVCYHLQKKEDGWTTQKIFDFSLPTIFITSLAESVAPLLPRYAPSGIYYVHYDEVADALIPYCYSFLLQQSQKINLGDNLAKDSGRLTTPMQDGKQLILGGFDKDFDEALLVYRDMEIT